MWEDIILFTAVGFAAQLIDGALGMAYGLSATTVLLSLGTTPAMASASVHTAEVFTTAASGMAHWRLGNVDRKLVVRLAIPGMIGGAIGAYLLANLPGEAMRPAVAVYLSGHGHPDRLAGGAASVSVGGAAPCDPARAVRRIRRCRGRRRLGAAGCHDPGGTRRGAAHGHRLGQSRRVLRHRDGFRNLPGDRGLDLIPIIAGLVLGGVVAAPFAALATRHIPDRPLMLLVGAVIVLLSLRELVRWIQA